MRGQADSTKLMEYLPQRDCAVGGTALLAETSITVILLILYFATGTN